MFGPNHGEVAPIQRGDGTDAQSLGEGYHGCVDGPEREIVIAAHELGNPHPIAGKHWLREEIARGEIAKEAHLRPPSQACFDEIDDFGDDKLRHQQRAGVGFEKPQTRFVVIVVLVDVSVQRSGIDD